MTGRAYYLKEVGDNDTANIAIPNGKTTLGRGPFLCCSNKKVSRNHAELELSDDGTLFITALHVNPCFYYEKGTRDSRTALEKGKRCKLNHGDWISLLPDSLHYEIILEMKQESDSKSTKLDIETEISEDTTNSTIRLATDWDMATSSNYTGKSSTKDSKETETMHDNNINFKNMTVTKEVVAKRKRTLPDWLIQLAHSPDATEATDNPVNKRKAPNKKTQTTSNTNKQQNIKINKQDVSPVDNNEGDSDEVKSVKPSHCPTHQVASKHNISDDSENSEDNEVHNKAEPKIAKVGKKMEENNNIQRVAGAEKRKPCEFGTKCYRKNPAHFSECSHPGDSDYASETEETKDGISSDDDDDRPECEYGTDCYRKNPQHRKEYKHTRRPQRKAAKEAKKKAKMRDDDDESADSFESSFINDDSDVDSNYSPDDEDIKTLKKEAKEFMRNKKMHQMK